MTAVFSKSKIPTPSLAAAAAAANPVPFVSVLLRVLILTSFWLGLAWAGGRAGSAGLQ